MAYLSRAPVPAVAEMTDVTANTLALMLICGLIGFQAGDFIGRRDKERCPLEVNGAPLIAWNIDSQGQVVGCRYQILPGRKRS